MTNTPRNPQDQNRDKRDQANVNDPNMDRDNDGKRRQQDAETGRTPQQGGDGTQKKPNQQDQKR